MLTYQPIGWLGSVFALSHTFIVFTSAKAHVSTAREYSLAGESRL